MSSEDVGVFKIVRAEKFELVDSEGQPRGFLATDGGETLAMLRGATELPTMAIRIKADGTITIHLSDSGGGDRLFLGATPGEEAFLFFLSPNGELRCFVGVIEDRPLVVLLDGRGRSAFVWTGSEGGQPTIRPLMADEEAWLRRRLEELGRNQEEKE